MQLHCRHWNFGFHPNLKNSPLTPRYCEAPGLHRDPVAICFLRNGYHGLSNMPQLVGFEMVFLEGKKHCGEIRKSRRKE